MLAAVRPGPTWATPSSLATQGVTVAESFTGNAGCYRSKTWADTFAGPAITNR